MCIEQIIGIIYLVMSAIVGIYLVIDDFKTRSEVLLGHVALGLIAGLVFWWLIIWGIPVKKYKSNNGEARAK